MKTQILEKPSEKGTDFAVNSDELLTTKELMNVLKIKNRQTIYKLIDEGMPTILVGKKNYRFIKPEVIAFLKGETQRRLRGLETKSKDIRAVQQKPALA